MPTPDTKFDGLKVERRTKYDGMVYGYWLISSQYVGDQQLQIREELAEWFLSQGVPLNDSKGWD